ncbi:hypothetical protein KZP23_08625 [Echinicola marina]|uniref:hypothetical protein n=1 Tax=Echinicola marina TaxID=2859768 RepID=UPI001CF655DE|nr:hypothetical protein [Echinicola marina]UCS95058.1 hypothetical protein KZP23_08625 [Echinicola marina]
MKKKRNLSKVVMAASVAAMGVGVFHSIDAEAQTTGGGFGYMCCAFNGEGCIDEYGQFFMFDEKVDRDSQDDTCTNHEQE